MGLSTSKCLQSCEGCVTASQADFNSTTLWKRVAYPGCVVRVGRCVWCCETWRGNTARLLRDNSSKQSCGSPVRYHPEVGLGVNRSPKLHPSFVSGRTGWPDSKRKKEKKKNKPGSKLTCKQGTGGWEWAGELFVFLYVPYIHSDRVKTELSCKNIKLQISSS